MFFTLLFNSTYRAINCQIGSSSLRDFHFLNSIYKKVKLQKVTEAESVLSRYDTQSFKTKQDTCDDHYDVKNQC